MVTAVAVSAAATVTAGVVLTLLRADELRESNGLEPMILAIQPFVDGRPTIPVLRITMLALFVSGALMVAALPRRAWLVAGAVAVLLTVAAARTEDVLNRGWNGSGGLAAVAELAEPGAPLAGGASVDYFLPAASNSTGRLMLYQWYLPGSDFTVVAQPLTQASSPYVFAERENSALRDAGAEIVWNDPLRAVSLWHRPQLPGQ